MKKKKKDADLLMSPVETQGRETSFEMMTVFSCLPKQLCVDHKYQAECSFSVTVLREKVMCIFFKE